MIDRKYLLEVEFDSKAQTNVVAALEEVRPDDVGDLVALMRTYNEADDVFLVTRMTPAEAREKARKLLEFADACEAFGRIPARFSKERRAS